MRQHQDDGEKSRAGLTPEPKAGRVCLFVAGVFVLLGVIANTLGTTVILDLMPWFLLLIVGFFLTFLIGWAASRHAATAEVKEKDRP